jgi:carboxylate-amine ligase
LDFVDDVVDHLGSRFAINWVHEMLEVGTGADRQLAVYNATNEDLVKVAEFIESSFLI